MHPAIDATNVACPDPRLLLQTGRRLQAKQYWRNWAIPGILLALGVFDTVNYIEMILTVKMSVKMSYSGKDLTVNLLD